ncbi:GntR family transcriptional regulator [Occultella gossypii]|uniref:GntR family transcriptional regulator n=1 Tax=Occultella gossypii TaxID=2800820 RepID=A0ABS7SCJ1_9MICO|nr:GntR family transcriptional regulator [Occultella gossypii]MBZ2197787.1 GntR family transcriptional regulator [Occultella gossypii]
MADPLYLRAYASLKERIEDGLWAEGDRLPTQAELTADLGISAITLKRAMGMLRDEGYVTARPRRGTVVLPRATRPRPAVDLPTIGYVTPSMDDVFGTPLLVGLAQATQGRANLTFSLSAGVRDREEEAIEQQIAHGVGALILLPTTSRWIAPAVLGLAARHFPTVIVDRTLAGLPVSTVTSDNVAGGRMATEYLFQHGHRRVGLVHSASPVSTVDERQAGYIRAHAAEGIRPDPAADLAEVHSMSPEPKADAAQDVIALRAFVASHPGLTGYVVAEYRAAVLLARAAADLGRSVPEDLSIVCFDAPDPSADPRIAFTHIRQDQERIGATAVDLALTQIAEPGSIDKVVVPVTLVEGGSVCAPATGTAGE